MSCAAAIVASGLRIMPSSGGRVGKGIYLAQECCKSGYYVRPSSAGEAIMFLVEAPLGAPSVISHDASHLVRPPAGFQSVQTLSRGGPNPAHDVELSLDGKPVAFATGPLVKRALPKVQGKGGKAVAGETSFLQQETVVYDEAQLRLRYVLKLRI